MAITRILGIYVVNEDSVSLQYDENLRVSLQYEVNAFLHMMSVVTRFYPSSSHLKSEGREAERGSNPHQTQR